MTTRVEPRTEEQKVAEPPERSHKTTADDISAISNTTRKKGPVATSQDEVRSLIETNYDMLLRIARSMAPSRHVVRYRYSKREFTAEDILHTVIMRLLDHWHLVPREPRRFRAYAIASIKHACADPPGEHHEHVAKLRGRGLLIAEGYSDEEESL